MGGAQIMGGFQQQAESRPLALQQEQQGQVAALSANKQIVENDAEARNLFGRVNVGAASGGVMPSSGSVRAVQSYNESQAILKDTYARYQGNLAEQNAYYAARATRYQGNQAMWGGLVSGGTTLLTGGMNYYGLKKAGELGMPQGPPPAP